MSHDSVSVTVEVPSVVADDRTAERARILLVLDAVRAERLSWRAAARVLGLSPAELLDLAARHGVPVVRYDVADWQVDRATLERLSPRPLDGR
jgi:predicted HTH domain antitoxin